MNANYGSLEAEEEEIDLYQEIESLIKKNPWAWQSVCGVAGLVGCVVAPLLGATADVITWFIHSQSVNSYLHVLTIVLCTLTIPLLLFGALCLDSLQSKQSKTANLSPLAEPPLNKSTPATAITHVAQQNTTHRLNRTGTLAVLVFLLALPATGYTQQTLFNVPTTDVLDKGKVYGELDIPFRITEPRFSSFVPRVVMGIGNYVEVGVNITGNIQPGTDTTTLVPAIKWKPYDGGQNGWAFVVGNNLFIPIRNRSYDLGNYAYAQFSKTFGPQTRLTFGGYHFSENVVALHAQRAGGQFGFEQPVTKKFALQADWFTGRHANGYFTPGFLYKLSPKLTGYFGYSLGNNGVTKGNHFLYAEVGFNFN